MPPSVILEFDRGTFGFELFLELLGVGLFETGLDGLGGAIDHVLGFLETEASRRADDLDDLDLLVASRLEDDVEVGLHFGCCRRGRSAAATAGCHHHATSGGFDAVGVLQVGGQRLGVQQREGHDLVAQLLDFVFHVCHEITSFLFVHLRQPRQRARF